LRRVERGGELRALAEDAEELAHDRLRPPGCGQAGPHRERDGGHGGGDRHDELVHAGDSVPGAPAARTGDFPQTRMNTGNPPVDGPTTSATMRPWCGRAECPAGLSSVDDLFCP